MLVGWESLVLVGREEASPLPGADRPEAPDEARPWLRATAAVQSDDPAIRAKAEELAGDDRDIEGFARRVMAFTSSHDVPGQPLRALDALHGLRCGGSCTSRANLAAALLRARDIPARTVAHLPTWAGPLYEHWLVEYWHPGAGWVRLETSYDTFRPQPWTMAVLNVANPDDEDRAFDDNQARFVMAGAPFASVHSGDANLVDARQIEHEGWVNEAVPLARLSGDEAEIEAVFEAARRAFERLSTESLAGRSDPARAAFIEAASSRGDAIALARALRETAGDPLPRQASGN
jgi:hypothetical protein